MTLLVSHIIHWDTRRKKSLAAEAGVAVKCTKPSWNFTVQATHDISTSTRSAPHPMHLCHNCCTSVVHEGK